MPGTEDIPQQIDPATSEGEPGPTVAPVDAPTAPEDKEGLERLADPGELTREVAEDGGDTSKGAADGGPEESHTSPADGDTDRARENALDWPADPDELADETARDEPWSDG